MSDKDLGQLITSLKTEAIEVAEKESEKILAEAKLQARQILESAEEKRDMIVSKAEQEALAILGKGESAFRQAGRDYSISVRNEVLKMFQAVLETETRKEFTLGLLKTAVVRVIENVGSDVELKFSQDFSSELAEYIQERFKSSEQTVSIIENNFKLNGFSISKKSQGWSYTISPEEVAEALKSHLNNNWINILNKKA